MKTFRQFLEAFNSKLNWNVMPSVQRPATNTTKERVTPEGEVTYHKDIGLPNEFEKPKVGMLLRYGTHAKDRSIEKNVPVPERLPAEFTIIEVQMRKYRVIKWVIRFQATLLWDVVMVVQPDGFVRTTWPNAHSDLHSTLDKSKYADKPNF